MMAVGLYAVIYALAVVPGLPLGFALFGRRHAAGWVAGAALGYFVTALALWTAIAAGHPSAAVFVLCWAVAIVLTSLVARFVRAPLVAGPPWTRRDTAALLTTLLLVPAIAGPPFARLGAADAQGNRYYRAYFTADFVWHMAVTSELKKFAMPPRNMYMPHRPLHYYWAYYLLPASVAGSSGGALADVETDLKANAIATALLLTASMFMVAWLAVPRAWPVAAGVTLAVVASSAEGLVALVRILNRGAPLGTVRDLNIDAISNWWFAGLRIDGIPRCYWWVPQHSTSYVLGLAALGVATAGGSSAPIAAHAIAGVALAGAIVFNPFVGAIFAVAWGLAIGVDALRHPDRWPRLAGASVAIAPAVIGLAWTQINRMTGGASGMLQFGLLGDARNAPVRNLLLSLGPALVPALVGLAAAVRGRRASPLVPAIVLALLALPIMHLVALTGDASWVGFRAGQLLLIVTPPLAAAGLAATGAWKRVAVACAVLALCAGAPTTVIDTYNAQDIGNLAPGPGFPWTQVVSRDERQALDWLRQSTPTDATVQLDVIARGSTTWSIVPSFAERRQAAGMPRTLVADPEYAPRAERVRAMYQTTDPREASAIAHALRIDYIWIDAVERAAYPAGMSKFETTPDLFTRAFENPEVLVLRVR